jgi:hypothetical protein
VVTVVVMAWLILLVRGVAAYVGPIMCWNLVAVVQVRAFPPARSIPRFSVTEETITISRRYKRQGSVKQTDH